MKAWRPTVPWFKTAFLFFSILQHGLKFPPTSGQRRGMPCPECSAGLRTTGGERKGTCQVHPITSGVFNRCANHTIWRSVTADISLCCRGLPWQHGSRVMADQVVAPSRGWSECVDKVGCNSAINLHNVYSNETLLLNFSNAPSYTV